MNLTRENLKKLLLLIAFAILLYVGLQNTKLVAGVLRYIVGLLAPFLIGGCIAFIANVPLRAIEKHLFGLPSLRRSKRLQKTKRVLSLLLTIAVFCGVITVVLVMVVPELYNSFYAIGVELSQVQVRVPQLLDQLAAHIPVLSGEIESLKTQFLHTDWKEFGAMLVQFLRNGNFLSNTVSIASSVVSGVANAIIGIVFAIYILLQKENLGRQFRRLFYAFLPEKRIDRFLEICGRTSASFSNFLSGQCLEAIILGLMFFLSMSVLGLPYALVIAVLIGVTALIPVFGAFIGCVVGVLLILMADPLKALWFLILFLVLQQIEGNLIYPRVVGGSVGLPPIWVLVAVTLGASVGGVLGMLFAIPLVSVLYAVLRETVRDRVKTRGIAENKLK